VAEIIMCRCGKPLPVAQIVAGAKVRCACGLTTDIPEAKPPTDKEDSLLEAGASGFLWSGKPIVNIVLGSFLFLAGLFVLVVQLIEPEAMPGKKPGRRSSGILGLIQSIGGIWAVVVFLLIAGGGLIWVGVFGLRQARKSGGKSA
jgi:hypothetical protein